MTLEKLEISLLFFKTDFIFSKFFSVFPEVLFIVKSAWRLDINDLLKSSSPEKTEIMTNIAATATLIATAASQVMNVTAVLPFLDKR